MGTQKLGKNIKKARLKAGLTQAQVAEKAGIHVNYFARIERGEELNPSYEVLKEIVKVLKMDLTEIFPA